MKSSLTKNVLADSLKKLMLTKALDRITIKEIVEECGLNRQTFYYHFQDIYDLLGWIYKSEALGSIKNCKSYSTWQQGFLRIFKYVENNKVFCQNSYRSLGRDHLEAFLDEVVFDLLIGVVNELAEGSPVGPEKKRFIAQFYSFAFIGLMIEWLNDGASASPEKIIENLSILVEGDISRAIEKFSSLPA